MVYVDEGYINFYRECVSLMAADTEQELHTMARTLGLPRVVFPAGHAHVYYISSAHRDAVLALGAQLVDRRFILSRLT